jgi:hypothetical protein
MMRDFKIINIKSFEELSKIKHIKPDVYELAVKSVEQFGVFEGSFGYGDKIYRIKISSTKRLSVDVNVNLYEEFSRKCEELGRTKADVIRSFINKWVRGEIVLE